MTIIAFRFSKKDVELLEQITADGNFSSMGDAVRSAIENYSHVQGRTERRVRAFVNRDIFKTKSEVYSKAMNLLVRQQMEEDTKRRTESSQEDAIKNSQAILKKET